jgi:hypothetical protein
MLRLARGDGLLYDVIVTLDRLLVPALFAASLALVPSIARAQGAPAETVTLRDGSVFRGELVEKIPGDHVTIKLATGEIKVFRWADIVDTPQHGVSTGGAGGTQSLEMTSDRPGTELYRIEGGATGIGWVGGRSLAMTIASFSRVCSAPCKTMVDPNATYFVAGDGITPSDRFTLAPKPHTLHLKVNAGSASQRSWGWVSSSLGLTGMIVGGTFILLGSLMSPDPSKSIYQGDPQGLQRDQDRADTFKTIGYVSLGFGAGFLALGIVLVATSGTDVIDDSGTTIARPRLKLRNTGLVATPSGFAF